jgi:hypothetical protein
MQKKTYTKPELKPLGEVRTATLGVGGSYRDIQNVNVNLP